MKRNKLRHLLVAGAVMTSLVVVACGDDDEDSTASGGSGGADTAASDSGGGSGSGGGDPKTAWCGDKEITLGIQDGGGLNGWSKESKKQVKLEAAKCKNIKKIIEVDAGFDVQKAISGFNGLVAQGANAIVIIPDAGGPAELPGIRRATQRGVKVVPWAADPTGEEGKDFEAYVDWDPEAAGNTWAEWLAGAMGDKGNVIFLGGPAGNAVDAGTLKGALDTFSSKPDIKMLTGDKPAVANWDPAETQKVTAGLITKNPQIDGIIVADGQSGAGAIRAFQAAGKKVPPIATLEANEISCIWEKAKGSDEEFALGTISARNWMGRYAVRKAVAAVNGVEDPAKKIVSLPIYEDSEGDKQPQCKDSDPPDSFFSNQEPDSYFEALMGS